MNYGRVEAANPELDLLDLPARKLANITLEWLMNVIDPEAWESDYKDLFFGDPALLEMERERKKRVMPAVAGEEGTWAIKRPAPEGDGESAPKVNIPGLRQAKPAEESPAPGPSFKLGDDGEMTVS